MAVIDELLDDRNTISTKDVTSSTKVNDNVIKMIECNKFAAKPEKNKEDVQALSSHWKKKKTTSVGGTGTLGGYLINSNWIRYGIPYARGGEDLYFDAVLIIYGLTPKTSKQVIQLTDANLDSIPIADFEADDSVVEWEGGFTFEGVSSVQVFNGIN